MKKLTVNNNIVFKFHVLVVKLTIVKLFQDFFVWDIDQTEETAASVETTTSAFGKSFSEYWPPASTSATFLAIFGYFHDQKGYF